MKSKTKNKINKKNFSQIKVIPREEWDKYLKAAIKAGYLPDKAGLEGF